MFEPLALDVKKKKNQHSAGPWGRDTLTMCYTPRLTRYLLALVDSFAVVLLDSLVFFFCWVAGFLSSCSSGSGAAGSLWSASELPLLVLGLSSSDLCLSLDILVQLVLGKLL